MGALQANAVKAVVYGFAWLRLCALSERNRLRALGRRATVHWHERYEGQPVLLLALFQKGRLRPDTLNLLKAARDQGYYVIAVNSLRLAVDARPVGLADRYVERFNFGRDFGSYQAGWLDLLNEPAFADCPRVVMLNDSVFFSSTRVGPFLKAMAETGCEVLGATENYEIEYHVGSFCISIARAVFRAPAFGRYWARYRKSDVRPAVIRRGEMGLSKVLRRCVSSDDRIAALYDSARFHEACRSDPEFLPAAIAAARTSDLTGWVRLSVGCAVDQYFEAHLRPVVEKGSVSVEAIGSISSPVREARMSTIEDAVGFLSDVLGRELNADEIAHFREFLASYATRVFMAGSQIHQNAAILLHMGLPIVKLDGLYRGMFGIGDVNRILERLGGDDATGFRALIFRRPFGGDTLVGWQRFAFFRGFI